MSPAEGRKFAFTVGTAFLVLAGVSWWRGHFRMAPVLGALGGALVLAGIVLPGHLGPVVRGWMGLAHAISKVTTPVFLAVVFFLVLMPAGLLLRLFGKHPLPRPRQGQTGWVVRTAVRSDLERQF